MYLSNKYREVISVQDAETKKRFELIEKLSRGFTVEHKTALEMDSLLVEQLELEGQSLKPKSKSPVKVTKKANGPKPETAPDVEASFWELFRALKNIQADDAKVNEAVDQAMRNLRVSYQNLDDELKRLISSQPQVIRFDIPGSTAPAFLKPPIASFQQIIDDVVLGANVMLVGGAGTGKTYMAETLIAKLALGRRHITINCSQWTSPTEIIGGQTMDGYAEGKVIEAWQKGYVLILDELPKMDPNTAGLFNDALAKSKIKNAVIYNARGESFVKHDDFACIATGNIYPVQESALYGANNKQDLSLLDRFSGSVYFIEKNREIEREILQNNMVWSICSVIRSTIEDLKYEAQLSLRFMQLARDSYNIEMARVNGKNKDDIDPSEGKTLKSAIDSFLSTFTSIQRENIKKQIDYDQILATYEYREYDKNLDVM